jgi:DinB superfamily
MSRLQQAIEQIVFARAYTIDLLDQTPTNEWFRQPSAGVTHIAWQVGHLAVAEYRLACWRLRDVLPQDAALIPENYPGLFGYDSTPNPDPTAYPVQSEIRAVFDRIHDNTLEELKALAEADLDQVVVHPHPLARNKFQALLWCARHEMLHAGQIGLLRRQLGYLPVR